MRILLSILVALCVAPLAQGQGMMDMGVTKAVCVVQPTKGNECHGVVWFETLPDGKVKVTAKISGLRPNQKHAIHVHEFGDITSEDGTSLGGHYNPEHHEHGLPTQEMRHAGDLGNLTADAEGNADYTITVDNMTLVDKDAIIGRGVVVHEKVDDGGQPTGNAGARIGVGVIGVAKS
jgi:superoxide dismutase, Cu-Zn family